MDTPQVEETLGALADCYDVAGIARTLTADPDADLWRVAAGWYLADD